MAKFSFRLQSVLEYRELQVEWAREALLDARAIRIETEAEIEAIDVRRQGALQGPAGRLDERLSLESALRWLDDEERMARVRLGLLSNEEEIRLEQWRLRRQDLESLLKLRERALAEWMLDEARREQAELDEWTSTRRTA